MPCSKLFRDELVPKQDKHEEDYSVDKKYQVAKYDSETVCRGMNYVDPASYPIRSMFIPAYVKQSLFGRTIKPLLAYTLAFLLVQILYQTNIVCKICFHLGFMPTSNTTTTGSAPTLATTTTSPVSTATAQETDGWVTNKNFMCNNWFVTHIDSFKAHDKTATKYLTFILGFYVTTMIGRWWNQIKTLPEIDPVMNYIAGLIYPAKTNVHNQSAGALELSKKIVRYCLLSWTMCLSAVSSPLNEAFKTGEDYIKKELITQEELDKLKSSGGSEEGWKDQWTIPMTWAVALINKNFNYPKPAGGDGLIPKDAKDIIKVLDKFQSDLDNVTKIGQNPLPLIYKQAVLVAVYTWMFLGIFSEQKTEVFFHPAIALMFNFPFEALVKYMLLFGWWIVADLIRNPFDCVDRKGKVLTNAMALDNRLDVEIWKSSVIIKNIDKRMYGEQ